MNAVLTVGGWSSIQLQCLKTTIVQSASVVSHFEHLNRPWINLVNFYVKLRFLFSYWLRVNTYFLIIHFVGFKLIILQLKIQTSTCTHSSSLLATVGDEDVCSCLYRIYVMEKKENPKKKYLTTTVTVTEWNFYVSSGKVIEQPCTKDTDGVK